MAIETTAENDAKEININLSIAEETSDQEKYLLDQKIEVLKSIN